VIRSVFDLGKSQIPVATDVVGQTVAAITASIAK